MNQSREGGAGEYEERDAERLDSQPVHVLAEEQCPGEDGREDHEHEGGEPDVLVENAGDVVGDLARLVLDRWIEKVSRVVEEHAGEEEHRHEEDSEPEVLERAGFLGQTSHDPFLSR